MRLLIPFVFLSCILSGCVLLGGAAVGAGAATYFAGTLTSPVDHDINTVWTATRDAADDLRLNVTSARQDETVGKLTAKNAVGSEITIELKRLSASLTEVSIRVGLIGDRAQSELILSKIEKGLR